MARLIITFVGLVLFMIACSGFSYKHYTLVPSQQTLLGPDPKDDLPEKLCEPDEHDKSKCVVLFSPEWERLEAKYVELEQRLKACESGH